ncbi:MAG: ParB/RepB/Spo0J family partition protein [Erythrobacter sp.]
MTITTVAPADLKLSPLNVRKSKRQHIEALADDIAAHGVIHNLVAYKNGKGFAVVAGGRRLEAIRLLQKQGRLPDDFAVPVSIRPKKEAVELSLAENQSRDDMHPADAIEAYGKLAAEGLSSDDIAARFGVTPAHVNRILSLANLHPDIRASLAKDEIGLDAAKAYTLTDDQERQLRLFGEFGNSAHMVRKALTDDKIATDSALFDLVSLAHYLEAGGTITCDLFSGDNGGFADNADLVWSLVQQHLEAVREEWLADGWREVEIVERQPDNYYSLNHIRPQGLRDLTTQEAARFAELEREADAITEADAEAEVWNSADLRAIDDELGKIEQARRYYTDEQKADAKVIIFLGYNGALTIQPLCLRKAKRSKKADDGKPERFSRKLSEAMHRIKLLAVREAVASNPDMAFDLMLAALIEDRLAYGINSPLALRTNALPVQVDADLLAGTTMVDAEEAADKALAGIEREDLLDQLAMLEIEQKQRLFAALVATLIDPNSTHPSDILQRLGIDMASKWQPDAKFFARMTKSALLDLLREQCGESAAENCRKLAKSDLAEEVAQRLSKHGWLPPTMCD